MTHPFVVAPEVAAALHECRAVVALESTLLTHGLPAAAAAEFGRAVEAEVRGCGAVPATIAVLGGTIHVGLSAAELDELLGSGAAVKAGIRDLPVVCATGRNAGTTVASTSMIAHRVGIPVFATGGLGGVHRDFVESHDESGDLGALGDLALSVVCSGVKSILDVGATLERLETLNVTVVGFATDRFPGFYVADAGFPAPARLDTVADLAAAVRMRDSLRLSAAIVVANPAPEPMAADVHDELLAQATAAAREHKVTGAAFTPFVLREFARRSAGASVRVNCELVRSNARLAAQLAVELAQSAAP